ncbi:E-selectin-like isoform X2 [Erpetoichthys calabaricus]|uniref:E-selectin-like isoform X2 n=1 Tax=Erpetoichthys calabaricus TaxID=27687 RepID=UPI002233FA39|nr:E-selectin-like isoform X2 [Erpetoichthys calabaricus]
MASKLNFQAVTKALLLCLLHFELVEGWTYHYSSNKMTWNQARVWCKTRYTDMVAIQNKGEIAYLNEILPQVKGYYWIGIRKMKGNWTWVGTNKSLTKEAENWAENEPNNGRNNEDCVEIYIKRQIDAGKWNDEDCTKSKTALCYTAACMPLSCNGHGECIETINNYTCKCDDGFYGSNCEHVVHCDAVENPEKGFKSCSHAFGNYSYKSVCDFTCENGYSIKGEKTVECTASKKWTSQPPVCEVNQCSKLTSPLNGKMNCTHLISGFSFGTACSFECDNGYKLKGSGRVSCSADGTWSSEQPECEAITCSPLKEPQNSVMKCDTPNGNFSYNTSCQFSCVDGFSIKGATEINCTESGEWRDSIPQCEAMKCETPEADASRTFNCSHPIEEFGYNTSCHFSCLEGFQLTGEPDLKCTASGQWSANIPQCKAIKCGSLQTIDNGFINCSNPNEHLVHNSTCQFSCGEGFVLEGASHLQCTASGQWSGETPACKVNQCSELTRPLNGEMACTHPISSFSFGTACSFECEEGYRLKGSGKISCSAEGTWSSEQPKCEAIACDVPKEDTRRIFNCSHPIEEFGYNTSCHFSCLEGFELTGVPDLRCTAIGQWSANIPQCKAIKCGGLRTIDNGFINCSNPDEDLLYNSTCQFSCEEGFVLEGASQLQCTASGQWSGETPACKAVRCKGPNPAPHRIVNCTEPTDALMFNSSCKFSCEKGFALSGRDNLQCTASGLWSAEEPHCKALLCEAPTERENVIMNCSPAAGNFSYNTRCEFSCKNNFTLMGNEMILCTASGQWTGQVPTCEDLHLPPASIQDTATVCLAVVPAILSSGLMFAAWLMKRLRQKGKTFDLESNFTNKAGVGTYKTAPLTSPLLSHI